LKGGILARKPRKSKETYAEKKRRLQSRTVEDLTVAGKILRDHFITEYLIDFKATPALRRACAVLGIAKTNDQLSNEAWQLMYEPYVAKEIQLAIDAIEEKNLINRNRILAGLIREAGVEGLGASHAARVSAWSKLANILKMDVKQIDANLSSRGGILVVPSTQKPEEWEARAAAAQAALKAEVRK
jgi:hypothetical protein